MRRHPDEIGDDEVELVHISRTLKEAERVEALLDERGTDYLVAPERYHSRFLFVFPTVRVGAFFYVRCEEARPCRELLASHGHQTFEG